MGVTPGNEINMIALTFSQAKGGSLRSKSGRYNNNDNFICA